jgi:hypothetical protein
LDEPVDEQDRSDAEEDPIEKILGPPAFCESQSVIRGKQDLGEKLSQCSEEICCDHRVFFKINTNLLGLCFKVFTLAQLRWINQTVLFT